MSHVALDSVRLGIRIFFSLIEKGEINSEDDKELMKALRDEEVRAVLHEFEDNTATVIIYGSDRIYISPGIDNKIFGYKNQELRERLKLRDNYELYTCYFIMLSILAVFYKGEGYDMKEREFVEVDTLHGFIDDKVKSFDKDEHISDVEESLNMRFSAVADKWNSLIYSDERKKNIKRSTNNRMAYIMKVVDFLADEKLLTLEDGRIIRTTEKMDMMVVSYYSAKDRKKEIVDFVLGR